MATDPKATVVVDSDTTGAQRGIQGLSGIFGGMFGTMTAGVTAGMGLFSVITKVVDGILAIPRAIGSYLGSSISMNASLESTTLQFETLMGNAQQAQRHVAFLFEFAKKTPFETGPIIEASKQMQVFGGNALNTEKNLTLVGNAAAATGKPINDIAMWTGRLYSSLQAGKPFGEAAQNLTQLAVWSPKVSQEMEKLKASGGSAKDMFGVFQKHLETFNGAMEKQAGTWTGLTSTMSDTISILGATAFAPFFDMAKTGLKAIVDLLGSEGVESAAKGVGKALGDAFGIIRATVGPVLSAMMQTGTSAINAANGTKVYEQVVRSLIGILSIFVDALAGIIRAVATVIQAYYEFRIAGNLLLVAFGKVVEGILVGSLAIANAMAKISFGETRKSFQQDAQQIQDKLNVVRKDMDGLRGSTEEYRKKSEATGNTLRGFADRLNGASKEMQKQALEYKYVAPAQKTFNDQTDEGADLLDNLGGSADKTKGKVSQFAKTASYEIAQLSREWSKQPAAVRANDESIKLLLDKYMKFRADVTDRSKLPADLEALALKFGRVTAIQGEANTSAEKLAKAQTELRDKMTLLSSKMQEAEARGMSAAEMMEAFGAEVKTVTASAVEMGIKVPENIGRIGRAIQTAEFDKAYEKTMGEIRTINKAQWDLVAKETEDKLKKAGAGYEGLKTIAAKAAEDQFLATKRGLDKQLAIIDFRHKEEIKKLGAVPGEYSKAYEAARAVVETKHLQAGADRDRAMKVELADLAKRTGAYGPEYERAKNAVLEKYRIMEAAATKRRIEEIAGLGPIPEEYRKAYEAAVAAVNAATGKVKTETIKAEAQKVKDAWLNTVSALADVFDKLANIAGGAFGNITKWIGQTIGTMNAAGQAGKQFSAGLAQLSGENKNLGAAAIGMATGIASGIAAMQQATNTASMAKNVIGGMTTGMSMGMQIAGPWGAAVGAAVGAIWAAFKGKPDWVKIQNDIKRDFGVAVSEELAKQIEKTSKEVKDRGTAIMLNLSAVLKEAGGITVANLGEWTKKTADLFSFVERKQITMKQATEQFNQIFPQMAKVITDTNSLASKSFLDLMATQDRFGVKSAEVSQFIGQQLGKAIAGLKAFVDNATITSQNAATATGAAVAAMFDKMVKGGMSASEALKALGPVVTTLEKQFATAGFTGGAAFDQIKALAATASNEIVSKAMTAVEGLNATMRGLHNAGLMDQQMFSGLGQQVGETFNRLISQGQNGDHVLRLMQPTLQTLHEMQRRFGYTTDESTQALLDQARASGQVGDQYMSAQDRMAAATDRVANAIEFMAQKMGYLPGVADHVSRSVGGAFQTVERQVYRSGDAFSRWRDEAVGAADDVYDAVDRVSFGASPGGLKEWKPMIEQAMGLFGEFGNRGVSSIRRVQSEVNSLGMRSLPDLSVGSVNMTAGARGSGKIVNVDMRGSQIAGVEGMNAFTSRLKQSIADDSFRTMRMELNQ